MKLKALVTAEVIRDRLESAFAGKIDFVYDGYALDHNVMPHAELVEKVKDYDVLVCEYDTVSKDVFEAAGKLTFIVCCRGGVKTVIDLEAAKAKGVMVCNNAGRNAGAVTDMVMGYLLDMTRNITRTSNLIHSRQLVGEASTKPGEYQDTVWGLDNDSPFIRFRGRSLNAMTLGIVGFGNVGRQLAPKAHAFGMRLLAYDPYSTFAGRPDYVEPVSWERLLAESDAITVHCGVSAETRGLFSKDVFAKMKEGAYFINSARGELVVEEDLVDALRSGHLAGAAIDVTRREPIPPDSCLVGAPNLLVTPHIAGSSGDVQVCGTEMVIASLTEYLAGNEPPHRVA